MKKLLSLEYGLDILLALIALLASLAVVQTFIVGKHYIIPTMILVLAVLTGNLARFGFRDHSWAKHINCWIGVVLTFHMFFALFWSKRYREILGDAFELVVGAAFVALLFVTISYARRNRLFGV
ncbi:MAG: hypothetical protein KJN72_03570 [Woeseia sp.]|nr:hypothetical protein [Woeseia sp.]